MKGDSPTVLCPEPDVHFVETPYVKRIVERALSYISAGFPVHFSGPAGVGKTTLAMHIAHKIGRPAILIYGDDEFGTSDLVGKQYGYRRRKVVDHFIQSVLKTEDNVVQQFVDDRLTTACKYGFTLIYDEFTRSRPEANNVLLSVLEEKILPLPAIRGDGNYLKVDPKFRVIFTSNPEEYAGVHKSQDALRDRMVTIKLSHFDIKTEIAITVAKSGISYRDARRIVNLVRNVRTNTSDGLTPTVRGCIIIARVLKLKGMHADVQNPLFREICMDVLTSEVPRDRTQRAKLAAVENSTNHPE